MPAKDIYHDTLKNALIKDGWTITHDPLRLDWGSNLFYVDLGAEKILAAEKADQKIAVEVKSFVGRSKMEDLEKALGQYGLYKGILKKREPKRILYLAVHSETFQEVFDEPVGELVIEEFDLRLVVFDKIEEVIVKWIP